MMKRTFAVAIVLLSYCAVTSAQDLKGFVGEDGLISLTALNGPVDVVGVDFQSAGGYLTTTDADSIWDIEIVNTDTRVTYGNLASSVIIDGTVTTNVMYSGDSPKTDLIASFGSGVTEIGFPVVPEPSAFCLSGLAAIAFLGTRRRR